MQYIANDHQGRPNTLAYLRISSTDHDIDIEKTKTDILKLADSLGLGHVHFAEEQVSVKTPWRNRKVADILTSASAGDTIMVSELSRLGRSILECMEILSLASQKGVRIYAVKSSWRLDSSIKREVQMACKLTSEIEHDLISMRARERNAAIKASGMKLGRPKGTRSSKLDQYRAEIEFLLSNGSTQRFIAKRYHTTPKNLSDWMKSRGVGQEKNVSVSSISESR